MTYQEILLDLLKNTSNLSSEDYSEIQTIAANAYAKQSIMKYRDTLVNNYPYPEDKEGYYNNAAYILNTEIILP